MQDADGRVVREGEGEALLGDEGLTVGDAALAWLDADAVAAADYRITLEQWPGGRLVLSQLGRRFDSFTAALRRCRDAARVAGFFAHGTTMPENFPGALLTARTPRPADFQVYDTHVTIVPRDGDPFQVPFGALTDINVQEDPPAVVLVTDVGRIVAGQLARKRDAFRDAVTRETGAQSVLLADLTGRRGFADGRGIPRTEASDHEEFLRRFTAPERLDGALALAARATGGEPRFGFVKLLDPEGNASASPEALPEHWASFLLVPVGPLVVLEILSGPSAATYVFEGGTDAVNRDLQTLHFRRAPLALTEAQAAITPENPHRLALRRLEPLKRLRAATRARIVHNEGWTEAVDKALTAARG